MGAIMSTDTHRRDHHRQEALAELMQIGGGGLLIALIAAWASHRQGLLGAIGISVLILLTAFAVGSLLGFLFGLPRVLSRDQTSTSAAEGASPPPSELTKAAPATASAQPEKQRRDRLIKSSTNLEQIADWLTTLLVGAGLSQIGQIPAALSGFRDFLEERALVFPGATPGEMDAGQIPVVGPVLLVLGVVCGFLYMYLSTRLVLVRVFDSIERFIDGEPLSSENRLAVGQILQTRRREGAFASLAFGAEGRAMTMQDALTAMLELLYADDPKRVIDIGAHLLNTDAANRPDYWFYLAAAFGQQMQQAADADDGPGRESARDNAMDCARRAVALDPSYRARLWAISDPEGPDGDLRLMRSYEPFLRLVGRA